MKTTILMMLLAGTFAHAEGIPSMTAQFTGYSQKTNHAYKITQGENSQWNLADTAPCPSYPCTPKDHTVEANLIPELLTDSRMADGNTEIQLSEDYKITFINKGMYPPKPDGTREESYWELSISKEGKIQDKVKLYFQAILKTH